MVIIKAAEEGGSGGHALSQEYMRGLIQTAVQAAMTQINAAGLDASIKEVPSSVPNMNLFTIMHLNSAISIFTFCFTNQKSLF